MISSRHGEREDIALTEKTMPAISANYKYFRVSDLCRYIYIYGDELAAGFQGRFHISQKIAEIHS